MTEFAFRLSDEFEAAIHARLGEVQAWEAEHLGRFYDEHPGMVVKRSPSPHLVTGDVVVAGFEVNAGVAVPEGLQRSDYGRGVLVPKKGAPGAEWRGWLRELGQRPSFTDVFQTYGAAPFVLFAQGPVTRVKCPALIGVPGSPGLYLRYGARPPHSDHLREVPLSVWFQTLEACDAFVQARESTELVK